MSGDRPHDDAFELDDELFQDDEFIIEFGDEDADETHDASPQAAVGAVDEPLDPLDFERAIEAIDAEGEDVGFDGPVESEPAAIAGGFDEEPADEDDEKFVVFDQSPVESAAGLEIDPDDILFSDARDDVSGQSDFGADLGPTFETAGPKSDYAVPDIGLEGEDFVAASAAEDAEPVEVEFDDGIDFTDDEDAAWEATTAPAASSTLEQLGVEPQAEADDFGFDPWSDDDVQDEAAADDYDPIYGDVGAEQEAFAEDGFEVEGESLEPVFSEDEVPADYAEYEEAYADATIDDPYGQVIGQVERRGRWRSVAAAAAGVPLVAAGVIAFMKPEWLGVTPRRTDVPVALVDRIAIQRPEIALRVQPQPVAFVAPEPVELPPEQVGPGLDPPVAVTDPPPVDPPVDPVDPGTEPPVITDPVEIGPTPGIDDPRIVPPVAVTDPGEPDADEPTRPRFYPAGPNLLIARVGDTAAPSHAALANGLRPGMQAFARLHNGAFFTGTVRRIEPTQIALDIDSGAIEFHFDDLESVVPLAAADLGETTAQQHGYVRLQNAMRLMGSLRRNPADNSVTLVHPAGSITIPKWQIDRVGFEAPGGVEIVDDGEDDWLRSRLRKNRGEH